MSDSKNREWILAARPTGNLTGNEFRNLAKSKFCVNLVAAKSRWATKCVALAPPRAAAMGAGRRPAGPRASPTSSVTTVSPGRLRRRKGVGCRDRQEGPQPRYSGPGCGGRAAHARLDRLPRSTRDLLNVLDTVSKAGAGFRSLCGCLG